MQKNIFFFILAFIFSIFYKNQSQVKILNQNIYRKCLKGKQLVFYKKKLGVLKSDTENFKFFL